MDNGTALTVRQSGAAASNALVPASLGEAIKLAELMARASLVPAHLQQKPADCLLVVEQAARWQMSPFAVAQATSCIQGKLMYEGKLVAAVINARGDLERRLDYEYSGSGNDRTVRVFGRIRGETKDREVTVRLTDAKTNNRMWQTQPDQQLAYHGARVWARRFMPELMLGVYCPEEMEYETAPAPRPAVAIEQDKAAAEDHADKTETIRVRIDAAVSEQDLKKIALELKNDPTTRDLLRDDFNRAKAALKERAKKATEAVVEMASEMTERSPGEDDE